MSANRDDDYDDDDNDNDNDDDDLGQPVPFSAGFSSSLVPGWKSILIKTINHYDGDDDGDDGDDDHDGDDDDGNDDDDANDDGSQRSWLLILARTSCHESRSLPKTVPGHFT